MILSQVYFLIFSILVGFSFVTILQDLYYRKVSNIASFSFIGFGLFLLFYFFESMTLFHIGSIIFFILLSFILFYKNVWGAADGKLFIGFALIFIATLGVASFLNFLVNMFLIYSVIMLFMVLFGTKFSLKKKVMKKFDYLENGLIFLLIFFLLDILVIFYNFRAETDLGVLIFFVLSLFWFLMKLKRFLKKGFKELFIDIKLMLVALFFMWNFLYSGMFVFIFHFVLIMIFRIFVYLVSELSGKLENSDGSKYESPFAVFLFLSGLITFLVNDNFISIVVKFFLF